MNRFQKFILHPVTVMGLACWGSFLLWFFTSYEFLARYQMRTKADPWVGFQICLAATVCFSIGYFIQSSLRAPNRQPLPVDPNVLRRQTLWLILVGMGAQGLIMAGMVASGGLGALTDSISGLNRGFSIPGVTTLVHLLTALPPLGAAIAMLALHLNGMRVFRYFLVFTVISFFLCLCRAALMGERIAILIPMLAMGVVIAAMLKKKATIKIVTFSILVPACVFFVFVGSEGLRSYRVKAEYYGLQQSQVEYGSDRLLLYYTTSVNAGIAEMQLLQDSGISSTLFSATMNPLWQILRKLGLNIVTEGYTSSAKYEILWQEGSRLKEFTNTWGFETPFGEGRIAGAFFWMIWGGIFGWFYRCMTSPNATVFDYAAYGILCAGVIDSSRVLMLGMVHILIPFFLILGLKLLNQKNYERSARIAARRAQAAQ